MNKINLKGIASNSVGYTGIVTLSQYINGKKVATKKVSNTGGQPLFDFLADCLVGYIDTAALNRPNKILLLKKDTSPTEDILEKAYPSFIYMTTNPVRVPGNNVGIVRYSFTIPQEIFSGTGFNAIGLYTDAATDPSNYAALCEINTSSFSLALSSVLILDWELRISN